MEIQPDKIILIWCPTGPLHPVYARMIFINMLTYGFKKKFQHPHHHHHHHQKKKKNKKNKKSQHHEFYFFFMNYVSVSHLLTLMQ